MNKTKIESDWTNVHHISVSDNLGEYSSGSCTVRLIAVKFTQLNVTCPKYWGIYPLCIVFTILKNTKKREASVTLQVINFLHDLDAQIQLYITIQTTDDVMFLFMFMFMLFF